MVKDAPLGRTARHGCRRGHCGGARPANGSWGGLSERLAGQAIGLRMLMDGTRDADSIDKSHEHGRNYRGADQPGAG